MADAEPQGNSIHSAEFHVTIFPHLEEFLVIDARDLSKPQLRMLKARDLLTTEHLRDLEQGFGQLLRTPGPPFLNMMALPARVQTLLQQVGGAHLGKMLSGEGGEGQHRISLFICAGPIVTMSDEELGGAFSGFFGDTVPQAFAKECRDTFLRLLRQERMHIEQSEREELRRAVLGETGDFYTMWKRPGTGQGPA
jgi:hypothetical protein